MSSIQRLLYQLLIISIVLGESLKNKLFEKVEANLRASSTTQLLTQSCYNGLHFTTNPTPAQVQADFQQLKSLGITQIRTYYPQYGGGAVNVPLVASLVGMNLLLGLYVYPNNPDWTKGDYENYIVKSPTYCASSSPGCQVNGILIGNENCGPDANPDMSSSVIQYLIKSKNDLPHLRRSTAQTTTYWLNLSLTDPMLEHVDFIAVNVYPTWDWGSADSNLQPWTNPGGSSITPVQGMTDVIQTLNTLRTKYAPKQIVVTESGWPTTYGGSNAQQFPIGIENAQNYLNLLSTWSKQTGTECYYYGDFDSNFGVDTNIQWNSHFGFLTADGTSKGVYVQS